MTDRLEQSKALANDARMSILEWLKEPSRHFTHQRYEDPQTAGVCVTLLSEKLGLSQPTVSRHLELLRRSGFIQLHKVGRWSFYRRNEAALADFKNWMRDI